MATRLSVLQLNQLFADSLGTSYVVKSSLNEKPLLFHKTNRPEVTFKAYIFNCTNPPGGRTLDEFKIQLILPNQKRGARGRFDDSDGSTILIVGYAAYDTVDNGAWVIWDTSRHQEFAYSANLQVKMGSLFDTITKRVFSIKKPGNGEIIVLADKEHLCDAISMRIKIDIDKLLEE